MAASDRPEQDELNKIIKEIPYLTLKQKNIQKVLRSAEWEDFMLGCDPAWHEHKGPIKQDDD